MKLKKLKPTNGCPLVREEHMHAGKKNGYSSLKILQGKDNGYVN